MIVHSQSAQVMYVYVANVMRANRVYALWTPIKGAPHIFHIEGQNTC
jgi:hypothetical protein